jgi:hypothetical protein
MVEASEAYSRQRAIPLRHRFEHRIEVGTQIEPASDTAKLHNFGTH